MSKKESTSRGNSVFRNATNCWKTRKVFIDAMILFMSIPDRINFLQMGRYGCFSEQTYRNNFKESSFDWFAFNGHIIRKHLTGSRKAIAVDPSYIPKSGKKTPWIGYFWSGCASEYKRGLEIMGIGAIDVDNRECMTLGSVQPPDTSRCTEHEVGKGKLYGLKAYSKALKRMVSLAVWYPDEDRTASQLISENWTCTSTLRLLPSISPRPLAKE